MHVEQRVVRGRRAADARGDSLRTEIVILVKGRRSRLRHIHFIVIANVIRHPHSNHLALDACAVPIILHVRRRRADGHARHAIFDIIIHQVATVARRVTVASRHVAVVVVTEIIRTNLLDRVRANGRVIDIGEIAAAVVARLKVANCRVRPRTRVGV